MNELHDSRNGRAYHQNVHIIRTLAVVGIAALIVGCGGGGITPRTATPVFMNTTTQAVAVAPDVTTSTVPLFHSSFTFDGKTFPFQMVGTNPEGPGVKTTIANEIIPVRLVFSNRMVFDPAAAVTTIRTSPLFVPATFISGRTQYGDAIMRGEFSKFVATKDYHVLLALPVVKPAVQIAVPAVDGSVKDGLGAVTFAWFIDTIEPQLIRELHLKPATLSIFVTNNVKVLEQSGHCCFNGFHDQFKMTTSTGPAIFTTVWGAMLSAQPKFVGHVGHEVAEWMNDPFNNNIVPRWVHPITGLCDGDTLEVGDPVVTLTFPVDGDEFEDATFFSWFSREVPSIGIDKRYDLLGKLTKPAAVC